MLCEMKGFDSFSRKTQFLQAHQDPYHIISNPSIWTFPLFLTHLQNSIQLTPYPFDHKTFRECTVRQV